jgi:hypothetical protein
MEFEEVMATLTPEQQDAITKRLAKVNEEAKGLRTKVKQTEDIVGKIKTRFNVDTLDDAFFDSLQKSSADKLTIEQRLETERKERLQLQSKLEGMTQMQREKSRDEQIIQALSKVGVRSDAISKALKLISLDSDYADGEWSFDGKPLDLYMTTWAKENAYFLGNPVKGGNGDSKAPNGAHNGSDPNFITQEEYLAMSPEVQRRPDVQKRAMASMANWK